MAQTKLYFFNSARIVASDGKTLPLPGKKTIALLAYLALSSAKILSRESLAVLFWPDLPDVDARNNLRVALARIKKSLESADRPPLNAGRHTIELNIKDGFWIDVLAFKDTVAQCHGHSHSKLSSCQECVASLQSALALYSGDFLEGFYLRDCDEFEQWQLGMRDQIRNDVIEALTVVCEGKQEQGEFAEAEQYTRQLLLLDPLREEAHRRLMRLMSFQNHRTGALQHYASLKDLLAIELGVEPDTVTAALFNEIERGDCVAPVPKEQGSTTSAGFNGDTGRATGNTNIEHNLPHDVTPFIGNQNLDQLKDHLNTQRLITLTGMGGIGKTRLAVQLAKDNLSQFQHGVFLLRLSALQNPDDIASALAETMTDTFDPGSDLREQLLEYLRPKTMLLIMDNFEHLLEGREFLNRILEISANTKILVTSRQKLMLSAEAVYPVSGLPYNHKQSAASELFIDAAKRVRLDFQPSRDDLEYIDQISRMVEGHPLALVLAAGWLGSLSCREIVDELDQSIELLQTNVLDIPERQRSVEATCSHSWRLLSDSEQKSFASMSIFSGGFDRDAASVVAGASLRQLSTLLAKSLLQQSAGTGRYELHELMRQFAEKKLKSSDRYEEVRAAHSRYYMQRLQRLNQQVEPIQSSSETADISQDFENIRFAWHNSVDKTTPKGLSEAVDGLRYYCSLYGREHDLIGLIEPLLPQESNDAQSTDQRTAELSVLLALGTAYRSTKGYLEPELATIFERAFSLSEDLDNSPELFAVLYGFWSFNIVRADFEQSQAIVDLWKRRLAKTSPDQPAPNFILDAAFIVHFLEGPIKYLKGEFIQAQQIMEAGLSLDNPARHAAIVATYGLNFGISGRYWLSLCLFVLGKPESAWTMGLEVQQLAVKSHQPLFTAFASLGLSVLSILKRDTAAVARYSQDLINISTEHRLGPYFSTQGTIFEASALPESERDKGLATMKQCLSGIKTAHVFYDFDHHLLVCSLIQSNQYNQARKILQACDELSAELGLQVYAAQSPLLHGVIDSAEGKDESARKHFQQSIDLAREQGAALFEFRAQLCLDRLESTSVEPFRFSEASYHLQEKFPELAALEVVT